VPEGINSSINLKEVMLTGPAYVTVHQENAETVIGERYGEIGRRHSLALAGSSAGDDQGLHVVALLTPGETGAQHPERLEPHRDRLRDRSQRTLRAESRLSAGTEQTTEAARRLDRSGQAGDHRQPGDVQRKLEILRAADRGV
jgi:hypothetical protein